MQQAAKAFTKQSGIPVQVIAASNLTQQVAQGFSGGTPPNVFYLDPRQFQNYAKDGASTPTRTSLPNASAFSPALTGLVHLQGQVHCEPKDACTLALYVNTADWQQAGLAQPHPQLEPARGGREEAHHRPAEPA